jgi:hypothetical protein
MEDTGGYHQADWEKNSWLTAEAHNFPLQYEVTTEKVIICVTNKDNFNSETHIVCKHKMCSMFLTIPILT